jgi:RNA recognition motif-containing protein
MEVRLYVRNLSHTITEADLQTLFAKAGQVTGVALIKDRDTDDARSFAFIEMSTPAEAKNAISMFNGSHLGNHKLKVQLIKPHEGRSSGFRHENGGKNQ